jgi:hypothetical protein
MEMTARILTVARVFWDEPAQLVALASSPEQDHLRRRFDHFMSPEPSRHPIASHSRLYSSGTVSIRNVLPSCVPLTES